MELTVLTESKSRSIGSGLTYRSKDHVDIGTLVEVSLRKKKVAGIVSKVLEYEAKTAYAIKEIHSILSPAPLLSAAQVKTLAWMSEYYCCTLRTALQLFLGPAPWNKLKREKQFAAGSGLAEKPIVLVGGGRSARTKVIADHITQALAKKLGCIILVPNVIDAALFKKEIEKHIKTDCLLYESTLTPAQRRKQWLRIANENAPVVIGTRSALFAPIHNLGLVVVDDEHDLNYKNPQAPRYHARLTAEILCRHAGAQLVLSSAAPSLESWKHAKYRYQLNRLKDESPTRVSVVDLADAHLGASYPLSTTLIRAMEDRLKKKEQSVLLLNRRGKASGMLCLDCRRMLASQSGTPLTVHDTMLIDHQTGEQQAVPATCPQCGSARLHAVGTGTQGVEALLKRFFPTARIARADSDAFEEGTSLAAILDDLLKGKIDILVGTAPVLRAIGLPTVTLAAALVADIGLSQPNFRSGERLFQTMCTMIDRMNPSSQSDVIIQTFRPQTPEIACAVSGEFDRYYDSELKSREQVGYPPFAQMLRLLLRGKDSSTHARDLERQLNDPSHHTAIAVPLKGKGWQVVLRGPSPRSALKNIDLSDVMVDVDPLEWE